MRKLAWLTVIFALTVILGSCGFLPKDEDYYDENLSDNEPEIIVYSHEGNEIPSKNPMPYDFGSVGSLMSIEKTFTIYNDGDADLYLEGNPIIRIADGSDARFSLTGSDPMTTIEPGDKTEFIIEFMEASFPEPRDGYKAAQIIIFNSDSDEGEYIINITGYDSYWNP